MKVYLYKYRYFASFLSKHQGIEVDIDDDEKVRITIDNTGTGYEVKMYHIDDYALVSYTDNGGTQRFLKGVGKMSTAAYLASCLDKEQQFEISDKHDNEYGIGKMSIMDNTYIIIGGYNNKTEFINITSVDDAAKSRITELVMRRLVNNLVDDTPRFDIKSMYIRITKDIGTKVSSEIFSKPYVYITKERHP